MYMGVFFRMVIGREKVYINKTVRFNMFQKAWLINTYEIFVF